MAEQNIEQFFHVQIDQNGQGSLSSFTCGKTCNTLFSILGAIRTKSLKTAPIGSPCVCLSVRLSTCDNSRIIEHRFLYFSLGSLMKFVWHIPVLVNRRTVTVTLHKDLNAFLHAYRAKLAKHLSESNLFLIKVQKILKTFMSNVYSLKFYCFRNN
jgi:hypothetical protein